MILVTKTSDQTRQRCVCVFFPFILDIKFVGRTSRGHTGFFVTLLSAVRALIFLARRIQPFLSIVDREVKSNFVYCTDDLIVLHPLAFLVFSFLVRKIPFTGIELTSQRVRRLRGSIKTKIEMPNEWRTIKSLLHKIRLHSRRGKQGGSPSKNTHTHAANPDTLEINKEAGGGAQGTQGPSKNCTSRESVSVPSVAPDQRFS